MGHVTLSSRVFVNLVTRVWSCV